MILKNNKMFNNSVAWYFCYRKGMTFSQHLGIVTHKLKERDKPFYFDVKNRKKEIAEHGLPAGEVFYFDVKNRKKEMFLYSFIEFYFNDYLREE